MIYIGGPKKGLKYGKNLFRPRSFSEGSFKVSVTPTNVCSSQKKRMKEGKTGQRIKKRYKEENR